MQSPPILADAARLGFSWGHVLFLCKRCPTSGKHTKVEQALNAVHEPLAAVQPAEEAEAALQPRSAAVSKSSQLVAVAVSFHGTCNFLLPRFEIRFSLSS